MYDRSRLKKKSTLHRRLTLFDYGGNAPQPRRRQIVKLRRPKPVKPIFPVESLARPEVQVLRTEQKAAKPEPTFEQPQILLRPKTVRTDVEPSRVRLFYKKVDRPSAAQIDSKSVIVVDHTNRARQTPAKTEADRFEAGSGNSSPEPQNFEPKINLADSQQKFRSTYFPVTENPKPLTRTEVRAPKPETTFKPPEIRFQGPDEANPFPSFESNFNRDFGEKITKPIRGTKENKNSFNNYDLDFIPDSPFPPRRRPTFQPSETLADDSVLLPPIQSFDSPERPKTFRKLDDSNDFKFEREKDLKFGREKDLKFEREVEKLDQLLVPDPYATGVGDAGFDPDDADDAVDAIDGSSLLKGGFGGSNGHFEDGGNFKRETASSGQNLPKPVPEFKPSVSYEPSLKPFGDSVVHLGFKPAGNRGSGAGQVVLDSGANGDGLNNPVSSNSHRVFGNVGGSFSFDDEPKPSKAVSYDVTESGEELSTFANENPELGFNNAPGPPYYIEPPDHAIYALPPEKGPIFRNDVDRIEVSTSPGIPNYPAPEQFGPALDLYSKDIYSQQSFAQLEPFFFPSDEDPRAGSSLTHFFALKAF
jgi:hypothetical protein